MLEFDERTARLLDNAYLGADVSSRRRLNFDAIVPQPGDRIMDIGCGTGLLAMELARAVGENGRIVGVDPSDDMRATALERCHGVLQVEVLAGTANELPADNTSIDKAVSVQVFEYLDDIPGAVGEAYRVLRPGGRLAIGDNHWDSLIWSADDDSRMSRMITAWDHHLAERCVPAILPDVMANTGFEIEGIRTLTFCDTTLRPDGMANMLMHLMVPYAVNNGHLDVSEANAWADEQLERARSGRFFFSLCHYVVIGRKN